MNRTTTLALTLALACVVPGCKDRPARDVREAETELTSARQDRARAREELRAKHSQERYEAQRRGASPEEMADLDLRHQRELAKIDADTQKDVSGAATGVAEADRHLSKERVEHKDKIDRRFSQLDQKANELRAKSERFGAAKKSEFDRHWLAYLDERRHAQGAIEALDASRDQDWPTWRDRTSQQLDALEKAVEKLDDVE
jgi:hypothetical protein